MYSLSRMIKISPSPVLPLYDWVSKSTAFYHVKIIRKRGVENMILMFCVTNNGVLQATEESKR